jgi:hypothetical protein
MTLDYNISHGNDTSGDFFSEVQKSTVFVTPLNNFNKFGGVTTLHDNNKTKAIEI